MNFIIKISVLAVLFLSACAPSRFIEPLEKKQLAVGGNFGGPLIKFGGKPIPVPLSAIEIGYGLDTNLTLHGGLHTTALFFGDLQLDAGVTYQFLHQQKYRPNISVNPGFNYAQSFSEHVFKFWPTLDLNAFYNYGRRHNYFYFGVNNMFELSKTMANDQPQKQRWLYNPQIGHVIKGKTGNYQFTTEIKFLGINQSTAYSFIPWTGLTGSHGSTGIFLGFRYIF
ncbi:MAG: hypothetical protein ACWA41_00800 [Putridiphycobacter sp.]